MLPIHAVLLASVVGFLVFGTILGLLGLSYRSGRLRAATALFAAGSLLATCPLWALAGYGVNQAVLMGKMANDTMAPDARVVADSMTAALAFSLLIPLSIAAFLLGVTAIILAFFVKPPSS